MTIHASAPGSFWLEIANSPTLEGFAQAFASVPVLEATVVDAELVGVDALHAFFRTTRLMYDAIGFLHEARSAARTYLEWAGSFQGRAISGITTLAHDSDGAIDRVRLYHFPRAQVHAFAAELGRRFSQEAEQPNYLNGVQS